MLLTPKQKVIVQDTHRFRVLCCGRRFGKTTLSVEEIKGLALYKKGARIVYIAPTIGQARDTAWLLLKNEMGDAIDHANDTRLEIKVKDTESIILLRGWEAIDTLRGQYFDFIVLDEIREMRNFKAKYEEVLIPTLTDKKGSVLFISTPNGFDHFYKLFNLENTNPAYKSFRFTTYDNPYIDPKEIDSLKESMTEDAFAQEYMADFRKKTGLVFKEFDRDIHVKDFTPVERYPIICGQDFGYTNPAAVLYSYFDDKDDWYIFDEYYETQRRTSEQNGVIRATRMQYKNPIGAVYGDSEDPQAISEFREMGWYITPAVKNDGSIRLGINKIAERFKAGNANYAPRIIIHPRCENFVYEIERYAWKTSKGDDRNEDELPEGKWDHLIDCARYIILNHAIEKDSGNYKPIKYRYVPKGGYG